MSKYFIEDENGIHLPKNEYDQIDENGHVVTYGTARQVCLHVIGMDYGNNPRTYHRHGKKYAKCYRNYFGGNCACLDELVERGLMTASPSEQKDTGENYWYHFTEDGLKWMAKELGYEKIMEDD